jgi:hypothetical protein
MLDRAKLLKAILVRGLWCLAACGVLAAPVLGQRHPESQGALPYYRDTPGTLQDPEWLNRPPFVRGPLDRYERGRTRMFLGTPDNVPYLNYANDPYILSRRETIPWFQPKGRPWKVRKTRWDRMGNYMGGDYQRIFSWEETRSPQLGAGESFIDHKTPSPWQSASGGDDLTLKIGHYSYKNFNWTATAGNFVRSYFTPLTLTQSHLAVARMDMVRGDSDQATILFNRGRSRPSGLLSQWASVAGESSEESPVLMYGLHWLHNIGGYANFSTTFLNQIMAFTSSSRSNALKGDLPYEMLGPRVIRVYIADDSPEEAGATALVYDVDIVIEGVNDGGKVKLTSNENDPRVPFDARLVPSVDGGEAAPGGARRASGQQVVVYEFVLPVDLTVKSARFKADVADDYRIGIRQVYDFPKVTRSGDIEPEELIWPADFVATEAGTRRPFKWYIDEDEEPFYTVVRSNGRRSGESNRKIVEFDYGLPTGQSLASVAAEANLIGLRFSGEAVHNVQNYMFPVGDNEGDRSTQRAWAYWFKGVKDLPGGLHLGGEFYRLDPDYSGGYDSQRGGMAFQLDTQAEGSTRVNSDTQEFGIVEDNDDDDQWPDELPQDTASPGINSYPGWPNASVYPGLDDNLDNVPDLDRNENFLVDWEEPFFTYESDPPEFVYGIDFNNNGLPDFRENDNKPDYPYDRDQKGRHIFARWDKMGRLGSTISLGYYNNKQIVGGGGSKALYLRYAYKAKKPGWGQVQFHYDIKKVEDDIRDDSYIYLVPPDDDSIIPWINRPDSAPGSAGFFRPATPDPLLMRDSWVSSAFVETRYRGLKNLNIYNAAMWMRNSQAEIEGEAGVLDQEEDVRTRFIVINKIDYTWHWYGLKVSPKLKHRLIFENHVDPLTSLHHVPNQRTSYSDFIPIVQLEYNLTPRTGFIGGAQGLPLLRYKHWDRSNKDGTFDQTDYVLMFNIRSEYLGFDNSIFIGYQKRDRKYSRLKDRDSKQNVLFVELISPF